MWGVSNWVCRAGLLVMMCAAPMMVTAQDIGTVQSQILVLDTERFFGATRAGQRITEDYQAERDRLIVSNRKIESELRAEEQALTDKRPTVSAKEFRVMADAFDAKVRGIRQANEREAVDLERRRDVAPLQLMRMAEPVFVQIMRDTGAIIVLDHRQVLLRADVIDITDLAIVRADEMFGDGSSPTDVVPETPAPQPEIAPSQPAIPDPDAEQ